MKLLLIEDHKNIADIIFDYFEIKGYQLDYAHNGLQGYDLARQQHYDLIILDVMLPKMDGLTVCKKLREDGISTPILMLTARDTREDILSGFSQGADDYLVKPFDLDILDARIKALTRRHSGGAGKTSLHFSKLKLNFSNRVLHREGQELSLNPTQFIILKL